MFSTSICHNRCTFLAFIRERDVCMYNMKRDKMISLLAHFSLCLFVSRDSWQTGLAHEVSVKRAFKCRLLCVSHLLVSVAMANTAMGPNKSDGYVGTERSRVCLFAVAFFEILSSMYVCTYISWSGYCLTGDRQWEASFSSGV